MNQGTPFLLHEDIQSIPGGIVLPRREMMQHLRSIYTTGDPVEVMALQQLIYLLRHQNWRYPEYHKMYWDKRMETLLKSGNSLSGLSEETLRRIVTAGFFHSGVGSTLTCYHCGCHAMNWEDDDDPWLRHLELQPNCPLIKGHVIKDHGAGKPSCSVIRRSMSCP